MKDGICSLADIGIQDLRGLSSEDADLLLSTEGYNELPSAKPRNIFAIALNVMREPMFLLLVAGGLIYLLLGDHREALMLLAFVFVIIGITLYQERKTENALQSLRNLSSPRARVIRDGEEKRIPGRDVVRGDIVIVSEGDRVPADGEVIISDNLLVDEALLTGESVPVRKVEWTDTAERKRPGGDDQPYAYSSTLAVRGQGVIRIRSTGTYTEIGKIGRALQSVVPERTPVERQTDRLVRAIAIGGVSLSLLVVIAYGITRGNWLQGLLAGVTLAMAMLPEEFPVVLTIFLALGAWRISRKHVLTRRMPAVETLGSATVLCVDKTGTITQNRMSVGELCLYEVCYDARRDADQPPPEAFHPLVEFSILASQRDPFDPMEKAFNQFGEQYLSNTEHIHRDWTLVREYPLSNELLAMSHVWRSPDGFDYVIAAKGAPEAIADLCHFNEDEMARLEQQVSAMAGRGLRVLGVARAYFRVESELPGQQHDFDFEFLGLVGLIDPIRPSVPAAVGECYEAGIRVVMITGDYPATARNIADQIGLRDVDGVITGDELSKLTDQDLRRRSCNISIYARVLPEQKLRIVKALKANNKIVAMTGDGVNDAPALKAADIGIAMGGRGTDVAREAAGIVLLDDDFSSIVAAIRLGRRIFDNLRKAMAYIFAIHIPIAGLSLIPVLLQWPLILMPVHILFMELIIDPACSIVFEAEPEESNVMKRAPRDPRESIFNRETLTLSALQGISILLVTLLVFIIALYSGRGSSVARAMTFVALIVGNVTLILTNVSWSRTIVASIRLSNRARWWVVGVALVSLGVSLYLPFLRSLFMFAKLSAMDLVVSIVAGMLSIMWFEVLKVISPRLHRNLFPSGTPGMHTMRQVHSD